MENQSDDAPVRTPRRISEKMLKIIIVVAVVAIIVLILVWGMIPEEIVEVSKVLDRADKYDGESVNVKGVVIDWNQTSRNFTLADQNDNNLTIFIVHKGSFPDGFGLNATAVVKGVFTHAGDIYTIESTDIQIGCPSKY
jgi:cytochrome c-type biogenesis protein CcmE